MPYQYSLNDVDYIVANANMAEDVRNMANLIFFELLGR